MFNLIYVPSHLSLFVLLLWFLIIIMIFVWSVRNCRIQIINNFGFLFSVFGIQESIYSCFICFISWLVSTLIHGYFVLDFLSSGIKFSRLTWRIGILFWCWTIFHVWKITIWSFSNFKFLLLIWIAVTPSIGFPNHPHRGSTLIVVFDIMCIH